MDAARAENSLSQDSYPLPQGEIETEKEREIKRSGTRECELVE